MSEELLMAHEKQVKIMQEYLEQNHEMLQLVSKQQKLWREHVEMEVRVMSCHCLLSLILFYGLDVYSLKFQTSWHVSLNYENLNILI